MPKNPGNGGVRTHIQLVPQPGVSNCYRVLFSQVQNCVRAGRAQPLSLYRWIYQGPERSEWPEVTQQVIVTADSSTIALKTSAYIPGNKKCPRHKQETVIRNPQHLLGSGTGCTNKDLLEVSGLTQSPSGPLGSSGASRVTRLGLQRRPRLRMLAEMVCVPRIFSSMVTCPVHAHLRLR